MQAIHTTIKGRARFKISELYRSESLKTHLERSLLCQPEIVSVAANTLTGNVLVSFDPKTSIDNIKLLIEEVVINYNQHQEISPKNISASLTRSPIVDNQQQTTDWHLMAVDAVLETLQISKIVGLTDDSATENLQKYGLNVLPESATRSDLSIFIDQFKSLPVGLLGVAAGVSLVTGGIVDALVIVGVVGLNAAIGYATESQSEKIIHSLKSREPESTWLIRNGEQIEIPTENVARGDVLILKPGIYVAADARLLDADNLSVDESALTGESIPVTKITASISGEDVPLGDRLNMVYKGTLVTGGQGLAAVIATGQFTQMGKIQQQVDSATAIETPLERQLDEVGTQLVLLSMGICGFVFGIGVLQAVNFSGIRQVKRGTTIAATVR